MRFAPLAFLRARQPPRTSTRDQSANNFPDSQDRGFRIEYHKPAVEQPFSGRQIFPGSKTGHPHVPSLFTPPPHYHLFQDEHFKVESGEVIWHLWGGKTVRVKKGEELYIPMRKWHWFETAPESTEPFSVTYRYDKEFPAMEERFFRNALSDLNDRLNAGQQPSIFQICVFCRYNWMALGVLKLKFERLDFVANVALMLLLAFIGEYLLGYQASYPEYCSDDKEEKA